MEPIQRCLPRIVERYARETPDAPAVVWADENLSYVQLNQRANRIAHRLREMGAGPGMIVGLCLPRGTDLVAALLGILKTGAAYLPLDPDYPAERLRRTVRQAGPRLMVTEEALLQRFGFDVPALCLQRDADGISRASASDPDVPIRADQTCYVIFTSGSTGEPKGVMVTHGNLVRMLDDFTRQLDLTAADAWSQIHSCSFGFSVFEIWGALTHGATLVMAPVEVRVDAVALRTFLALHRVTILSQTPSAFRETVFAPAAGTWSQLSVRALVLSGEAVREDDLQRWADLDAANRPRLLNTYAITETGGNLMLREYAGRDIDARNIGRPLDHVNIHVLDADLEAVASGEPGELYVSGDGVASGYINDDALTASRFVCLPNGLRAYRTGDRVRGMSDGSFEFLGRDDDQLKWRGFRLEPGEIETLLRAHPGVREAAIAIRTDAAGNDKLVAYVVSEEKETSEAQAEIWPSLGGYQIYDDFLYDLMSTDTVRNAAFRAAFDRHARDRVVLDLGTGPRALLAQMAARAGARRVYAVEVLHDAAQKAKATVAEAGLADRVEVIEGDAAMLELTSGVEVCSQGIIVNIGSADGIAPIWNRVRSRFSPDCVPVPARCTTMIAAVELPEALHAAPAFTPLAREYVRRIFAAEGRTFDPRLCVRNLDAACLISDSHVFEDLDFRQVLPEAWQGEGRFTLQRSGRFDGFLLWTVVAVADGITLDYLSHQHAWLPVFIPLPEDDCRLPAGASVSAKWQWMAGNDGIFPDYRIDVDFEMSGQAKSMSCVTRHHETSSGGTALHSRLLASLDDEAESVKPEALRAWLERHLPKPLLPNAWVYLDELPRNPNGKLDRRGLPVPEPVGVARKQEQAVPARSALEADLVEIWSEILGISSIGVQDDFFDLGGDSILAVRLTNRIQQLLDDDVSVAAIFEAPTIGTLAGYLGEYHREAVAGRY